jgi:hypothetical protein
MSTTFTPGIVEYNLPFTIPAKKSLLPQSVVRVTICINISVENVPVLWVQRYKIKIEFRFARATFF